MKMKSFLAVLAGLVFTIVASTLVDFAMYYSGVFPSPSSNMTAIHWAIATAYRIVIAIAGCWLAARLAPSRPMLHALITGAIGTVIALLGLVFTWNRGPAFGPHWYPILLVLTAMPSAWVGGRLGERKMGAAAVS
jgi:hypothetical protein